ncbi:MAG: hypothetical protein HQK99_12845 [Nitrospirae bacterium]|nr:hypothetical protein [Nitrospirota bacterium]
MFKEYIEAYILRDRKRTALFFILVAAVFFIDKLTLGPLAAVQLHDVFDTDFLRYKPMGELLFKHGLYFWYPNWPGGAPAYAGQHSPFYILNVAAQVFPLWAVYSGLLIAMMSAAGYGMYRFLSGYLKAAGWVAAVGGVYFAINMQLTNLFVLYTFCYAFPLYFAWAADFTHDAAKGSSILKLTGLNLFVALSYPVLTLPYFFILEVLVILLLHPEGQNTRLRMLVKTSLVWLGYVLVSLPVLYGLYKYIPFSHRSYEYEAVSATGFLKDIHNGVIGSSLTTMTLIPLAGAAAISNKSVRVRRGLIVIAILVFLFAMFSSGMKVIFRGTLLEKMDLGHINMLFPIVMTITAFMAIDAVIKDRELSRRFLIGEAVGAAYAVFAIFITSAVETQGAQLLILNIIGGVFISLMILTAEDKAAFSLPKLVKTPAAVFIFSAAAVAAVLYFSPRKIGNVDLVSIAPVLVVSMWAFFWLSEKLSNAQKNGQLTGLLIITLGIILFFQVRFTRFFGEECVPYISILPEMSIMEKLRTQKQNNKTSEPFRIASLYIPYIPVVQTKGFETPDGRGPLFNKYYREFIGILRAPELTDFIVRHNFETNRYNLFISDGNEGFYFYPLAFLNIRYFILTQNIFGSDNNFEEIYRGTTTDDYNGIWKGIFSMYSKPFSVVKCNTAFDRWFLVKKTSILKSDEDVRGEILKSEGEGLLDTVYYSEPNMPTELNGELSTGDKIIAKHYSPDEIRLDIEVTSPAVLVISNNYDPNWRAYINGVEKKIHRADIAFQSVLIENPGHNSVVLRYEDKQLLLLHIFIPLGIFIYSYALLIKRRRP